MKITSIAVLVSLFSIVSCSGNKETDNKDKTSTVQTDIREEMVNYDIGGVTHRGYVAYDANQKGKLPVVLVVHEWWGQTEYIRRRTKEIAALGYLAFAVDMYGNGKIADNPEDAMKLAGPFYADPRLVKSKLEGALLKVRSMEVADTVKTAAIGYCFGGAMVLNGAKQEIPFNSVVSFHGGLQGPAPKKGMETKFLILHGGSDPFVPEAEVNKFKKQMDSVNANYTFKVYPGATHAFTNPEATENGKKFNLPIAYHAEADSASWNDMKEFLEKNLR